MGLATMIPRMKKRLAKDETQESVGGFHKYAAPPLKTCTDKGKDIVVISSDGYISCYLLQ